jgi:hypothetical protein
MLSDRRLGIQDSSFCSLVSFQARRKKVDDGQQKMDTGTQHIRRDFFFLGERKIPKKKRRVRERELSPTAHYLDIIGFISIDIAHANKSAHDMYRDGINKNVFFTCRAFLFVSSKSQLYRKPNRRYMFVFDLVYNVWHKSPAWTTGEPLNCNI